MDKFPLLRDGRPAGELIAEREALYTWFEARCPLPGEGLWCAWAVGDLGELRLGILEPVGDLASIRRRFSARLTDPLGRLQWGEIRPACPAERRRLFRCACAQQKCHGPFPLSEEHPWQDTGSSPYAQSMITLHNALWQSGGYSPASPGNRPQGASDGPSAAPPFSEGLPVLLLGYSSLPRLYH